MITRRSAADPAPLAASLPPPRLVVRAHPRCLDHRPSLGHPEAPARVKAVLDAVDDPAAPWSLEREATLPPADDILGALRWLHEPAYVERFRAAAATAPGHLDSPDCVISRDSFEAATAAAGLAVQAALDLVNGRLARAFVVLRPPSHHAERARARGYCFFNSVALAAELVHRALDEPVLVVDFDVHHGNGTQALFYDRAEIGYLSVHEYPAFPGSGAGDEVGTGPGRGATRNIPLAAGADDAIYATALERGLEEMGSRLRPAALVVSAGFDGHAHDPLGRMELSADGFRRMTARIVDAAERWCSGRVLSFLEGGFEQQALTKSARAHVEELAGKSPQ